MTNPPRMIASWILALFLVSCMREGINWTPEQDAFAEKFYSAHKRKDLSALRELFCWDGVTPPFEERIMEDLEVKLSIPIRTVDYEPLEQGDEINFTFQDRTYKGNLEGKIRFLVTYELPEKLHESFTLGIKEGQYKIVNPRPAEGVESENNNEPSK